MRILPREYTIMSTNGPTILEGVHFYAEGRVVKGVIPSKNLSFKIDSSKLEVHGTDILVEGRVLEKTFDRDY